jgi:hypothetical protein
LKRSSIALSGTSPCVCPDLRGFLQGDPLHQCVADSAKKIADSAVKPARNEVPRCIDGRAALVRQ